MAIKFQTYGPAVRPGVINAPAYQAPRDVNAYGGSGQNYGNMAAAFGQVNKVLAQQRDDEDAVDVMNARNQIMTSLTDQLYNSETGLFTTGIGENAKGLTDRVNTAINNTVEDVIKKQNPRVAYALRRNISDNLNNFQRIAAGQEKEQKEAVDKANYDSSLANNNQLAALNYDKPSFIASQLRQNDILIMARGKMQGWSGEIMENNRLAMTTDLVGGAVAAAIANDDEETAMNLLTQYRADMNQDVWGRYYANLKQKQEIKTMDLQVRDIMEKATNPDGTINIEMAYKMIDDINGPKAIKTITSAGISNKDDFFAAVGQQESGGNYNAENAESGAFGKYQIMPGNWEGWKNEAASAGVDVASGEMTDPKAQEAVAKFKLGQYYDRYGAEGALVAWYAGETNGQRWKDGAPDAIGEGGHYSWDAPQGDNPSVREYVRQSLGRMKGGTPTNREVSAYDPNANQKMKSLIDAMAADRMKVKNQREQDYLQSVGKSMQSAGSYSGAIGILEGNKDNLTLQQYNSLKSQAASYYNVNASTGQPRRTGSGGSGRAYNPAKDQHTLQVNSLRLQMGENLTAEQIVAGNEASERLIANGYSTGSADLDNQDVMSAITDMLDNGASVEQIKSDLIATGASEETANYYISLIDNSYFE